MAVWQLAPGGTGRDFSEVFFRFGVMLVGPGSDGDYRENAEIYNDGQYWDTYKYAYRIAEEVKLGDRIIVKKPLSRSWQILGVGEVVGDYDWIEAFGDVDGWDLQHSRSVAWRVPEAPVATTGLSRGTLIRAHQPEALDTAEKIWRTARPIKPSPSPKPSRELSMEELIGSLVEQGVPVGRAETVTNTVWRIRRLASWYNSHGRHVSEHEIRTFLIAPLITALGWPEQRIKIEWNHIDMSLFDRPYTKDSKPLVIIESKGLWAGLSYAESQAQDYAKSYPSCSTFIVSDGLRYKMFRRTKRQWRFTSYVNLVSPRLRHPYMEEVSGARDFFIAALPENT